MRKISKKNISRVGFQVLYQATKRKDLTPYHPPPSLIIGWQHKLCWGQESQARIFRLHWSQEEKWQAEKRTHYLFQIFPLSNFPLLSGKISAMDTEEICTVKSRFVLVTTHATSLVISCSLAAINNAVGETKRGHIFLPIMERAKANRVLSQ